MSRAKGFLPPGWKKKWKRWNNSYPWIPPRTGEWPEKDDQKQIWSKGANMRRRKTRAFTQKPWNKPTAAEKFWSYPNGIEYSGAPTRFSNMTPVVMQGHTPEVICAFKGSALAGSTAAVTDARALQEVRIHRFDGPIMAWLDPNPPSSLFVAPTTDSDVATPEFSPAADGGGMPANLVPENMMLMFYWWFKFKSNADAYNVSNVPDATQLDPSPLSDLNNILLRRDVIKWGILEVHGRNTLVYNGTGLTGQRGAMNFPNPGFMEKRVTRVPFPRVPKGGFVLKENEMLMCVASKFNGPNVQVGQQYDDSNALRDLHIFNFSRVLCSR